LANLKAEIEQSSDRNVRFEPYQSRKAVLARAIVAGKNGGIAVDISGENAGVVQSLLSRHWPTRRCEVPECTMCLRDCFEFVWRSRRLAPLKAAWSTIAPHPRSD
jgi:hypothetical protein